MVAAKAEAPLPGSKAAAETGMLEVTRVEQPAPQAPPGMAPAQLQTYKPAKMGDWVRYIAPDSSERLALVVHAHEWGGAFATEVDPLYLNLRVFAIDLGDAQLWRESDVHRLPGEMDGFVAQVPAQTGEIFSGRSHTWRWPAE